jgi:hypothetical protein
MPAYATSQCTHSASPILSHVCSCLSFHLLSLINPHYFSFITSLLPIKRGVVQSMAGSQFLSLWAFPNVSHSSCRCEFRPCSCLVWIKWLISLWQLVCAQANFYFHLSAHFASDCDYTVASGSDSQFDLAEGGHLKISRYAEQDGLCMNTHSLIWPWMCWLLLV